MKSEDREKTGSESSDQSRVIKWFFNLWKRIPSWGQAIIIPVAVSLGVFFLLYFKCGHDINNVISLLDSVSVITGTFTTILALITWFSLQTLNSRASSLPPAVGEDAAILSIGIGLNISQSVLSYCRNNEGMQDVVNGSGFTKPEEFETIREKIEKKGFTIENVKPGQRILHISKAEGFSSDDLEDLSSTIYGVFKMVDNALRANGIGTIHLFYGGMAAIPFFIGELFSNRYEVCIYHFQAPKSDEGRNNKGKTYFYCGRMNHLQ